MIRTLVVTGVLTALAAPAFARWPDAMRKVMHEACVRGASEGGGSSGQQSKACWCMVRRVESRYTLTEFAAIADATDGEVPAVMKGIALECALEAVVGEN